MAAYLDNTPSSAPLAPVVATSLDPLETNTDLPGSEAEPLCPEGITDSIAFRHSGWAPTRQRVRRALYATGAGRKRLERFDLCGSRAWVMESLEEPGVFRISSDTCHDRFCLPCANVRSRTIAANVLDALKGKQARFITLTLRGDSKPLVFTLRKVVSAFARLRARKLWKQTQHGGCCFLEIKLSRNTGLWNVHYHIISQGSYIEKHLLSRAWQQITGTSFIVDVKYIKDTDKVARYVTKYASKPLDATVTNDVDALTEAIAALKGRRLCSTFGTWRTISLTDQPQPGEWIAVCPFRDLLHRVVALDPEALLIWQSLKGENSWTSQTTTKAPRPPPTPQPQWSFNSKSLLPAPYAEQQSEPPL